MRLSVYCSTVAITLEVVRTMLYNFNWPTVKVDTVRTGQRVVIENATDAILTYLRTHVPDVEIVTEV